MRLLRFVRRYPLVLLAVIAVVFIGWVWWDALPPNDPKIVDIGPNATLRRTLPSPLGNDAAAPRETDVQPVLTDPTQSLAKLKVGMMRAEVERLVGAPAAHYVSPATVTDGRVTYQTAYEADFGPAPTVRPINVPRPPPVTRVPDPTGKTLVTLEFDATKPGHPLVGVHYPDPLF